MKTWICLFLISYPLIQLWGQTQPATQRHCGVLLKEVLYNYKSTVNKSSKYMNWKSYFESEDFKNDFRDGHWSGGLKTESIFEKILGLKANASSAEMEQFISEVKKVQDVELTEESASHFLQNIKTVDPIQKVAINKFLECRKFELENERIRINASLQKYEISAELELAKNEFDTKKIIELARIKADLDKHSNQIAFRTLLQNNQHELEKLKIKRFDVLPLLFQFKQYKNSNTLDIILTYDYQDGQYGKNPDSIIIKEITCYGCLGDKKKKTYGPLILSKEDVNSTFSLLVDTTKNKKKCPDYSKPSYKEIEIVIIPQKSAPIPVSFKIKRFFPKEFVEKEVPSIQVQEIIWMAEDCNKGLEGCHNLPKGSFRVEEDVNGERKVFYNFNGAQHACPKGWRLPTISEWNKVALYEREKKDIPSSIWTGLSAIEVAKKLNFKPIGFYDTNDNYVYAPRAHYWSETYYRSYYIHWTPHNGQIATFHDTDGPEKPPYAQYKENYLPCRCVKK